MRPGLVAKRSGRRTGCLRRRVDAGLAEFGGDRLAGGMEESAVDQPEAEDALDRLAEHPAGGAGVAVPDHPAGVEGGDHVGGLFVGLAAEGLDLVGGDVCMMLATLEPEPVGGGGVLAGVVGAAVARGVLRPAGERRRRATGRRGSTSRSRGRPRGSRCSGRGKVSSPRGAGASRGGWSSPFRGPPSAVSKMIRPRRGLMLAMTAQAAVRASISQIPDP